MSSAGVSDGGGAAASGVGSAEGAGVSACNSGGIFSATFDCLLKNTILETYRVRWAPRDYRRVCILSAVVTLKHTHLL